MWIHNSPKTIIVIIRFMEDNLLITFFFPFGDLLGKMKANFKNAILTKCRWHTIKLLLLFKLFLMTLFALLLTRVRTNLVVMISSGNLLTFFFKVK